MKPRNPLVVEARRRRASVIKDKRMEEKARDLDLEIDNHCASCIFYNNVNLYCTYYKKSTQRNFICKNFLFIEEDVIYD